MSVEKLNSYDINRIESYLTHNTWNARPILSTFPAALKIVQSGIIFIINASYLYQVAKSYYYAYKGQDVTKTQIKIDSYVQTFFKARQLLWQGALEIVPFVNLLSTEYLLKRTLSQSFIQKVEGRHTVTYTLPKASKVDNDSIGTSEILPIEAGAAAAEEKNDAPEQKSDETSSKPIDSQNDQESLEIKNDEEKVSEKIDNQEPLEQRVDKSSDIWSDDETIVKNIHKELKENSVEVEKLAHEIQVIEIQVIETDKEEILEESKTVEKELIVDLSPREQATEKTGTDQ